MNTFKWTVPDPSQKGTSNRVISSEGNIPIGAFLVAAGIFGISCFAAANYESEKVKAFAAIFASLGGLMTAYRYVREKIENESLSRYEKIMTEWGEFVRNPELIEAIHLLEVDHSELERLLSSGSLSLEDYKKKNKLDQIFENLQRLSYAADKEHLSNEDVLEAVGWYFKQITENKQARLYCINSGYKGVVEFYEKYGS